MATKTLEALKQHAQKPSDASDVTTIEQAKEELRALKSVFQNASVSKPFKVMDILSAALIQEAKALDSSSINRANIKFSQLSQKIALKLLEVSPTLSSLEEQYSELATAWNKGGTKPPFCCVEGVMYAKNVAKWASIKEKGHLRVCVPFYKEFARGSPATNDNPYGEEAPVQKFDEFVFFVRHSKIMSAEIIFVNDSIAEKKDEKDGGSVKLFKKALMAYTKAKGIKVTLTGSEDDFESFVAMDGLLTVRFTSVGLEAAKGGKGESAEAKTKRLENRGKDGKLRERKGGAVLAGMEMPLPKSFADKPKRVIRCLLDGDSTCPVGTLIGDAAYAVLEQGHTAYLGNLKHAHTIQSIVGAGSGGAGTQARVLNRKVFFSGFIVPFLFPELTSKYGYKGTTQLPVKAFRGDIDFAKAMLPTVQPNVDLGMLALTCTFLNNNGGTIASGAITLRDNIASSTMTTSDLSSEWNKTYGPIFTSAVGLCRTLKPDEFSKLPKWLTKFIEGMELKHYTTLFGETSTPKVEAFFEILKRYRFADDRKAVLAELKTLFDSMTFA